MKRNVLRNLSSDERAWLEYNYPHKANAVLAAQFSVSSQSINMYAKRRGWQKSESYMKAMARYRNRRIQAMRKKRGDTFAISEACLERNRRNKGKTMEEIYGGERAVEIRAKISQSCKDLKDREWTRRMCGLPPLTKKNFWGVPKATWKIAYHLRRYGYRVDYKTMTAYYSETTQRSEYYEGGRCGKGMPFRFKSEPVEDKQTIDTHEDTGI